jgi:hypothetical protein
MRQLTVGDQNKPIRQDSSAAWMRLRVAVVAAGIELHALVDRPPPACRFLVRCMQHGESTRGANAWPRVHFSDGQCRAAQATVAGILSIQPQTVCSLACRWNCAPGRDTASLRPALFGPHVAARHGVDMTST